MAVAYKVYGNTGNGGPIDYTTVLATVSGLTWQSPALAAGSAWQFAVRSTDTVSGLTEANVDARVAVNLDANGNDLGALPPTPTIEGATVFGGNSCRLDWSCFRSIGGNIATQFAVFTSTSGSISPTSTPALIVTKAPTDRTPLTGCILTGLAPGSTTIGVAAKRGASLSSIAATTVNVATSPPAAPDQFAITTTDQRSV